MSVLQDSPAGCGPSTFVNILEAAGVDVTQEVAWKLCGCTGTSGTSERGILKAIRTLGHRAIVLREADPGIAITVLRGYLLHGVPFAILADNASHWIAATGTLGPRIVAVDPADGKVTQYHDPDAFLGRWKCEGEKYYAIGFVKKGSK